MFETELAAVIESGMDVDLAQKVHYNLSLDSAEKETVGLLDEWARNVAESGDANKEIAQYIKRVLQTEMYETPDALIDEFLERGSVGEFDDFEVVKTPKNTLVAYEAAPGGTVDRSWIDWSGLKPTWHNFQVEFDLSYRDMRRNGFKNIATLTTYAQEALKNCLFAKAVGLLDEVITGGDQVINESGAMPTIASMDALALYVNDFNQNGSTAITLNKYAMGIGRMPGIVDFLSDSAKDEYNRYGLMRLYQGMKIAGISSVPKVRGGLLIPDKRVFGIAGRIGTLDMKGDIHVYEDFNNQDETVKVSVKDFTFGLAITNPEKVAKIVLEA